MATATTSKKNSNKVAVQIQKAVKDKIVLPANPEADENIVFNVEMKDGEVFVYTYVALRGEELVVDTLHTPVQEGGMRCILVDENNKVLFKAWELTHPDKKWCFIAKRIKLMAKSKSGDSILCRVEEWANKSSNPRERADISITRLAKYVRANILPRIDSEEGLHGLVEKKLASLGIPKLTPKQVMIIVQLAQQKKASKPQAQKAKKGGGVSGDLLVLQVA